MLGNVGECWGMLGEFKSAKMWKLLSLGGFRMCFRLGRAWKSLEEWKMMDFYTEKMGCYPHQKGRSTKNNENWSNWNRENHGNFTSKNQPWAFIISTTKHLHQQTQLAVVHHVAIWVDSAAHHAGTGISSVDEIHHLGFLFHGWRCDCCIARSPTVKNRHEKWQEGFPFGVGSANVLMIPPTMSVLITTLPVSRYAWFESSAPRLLRNFIPNHPTFWDYISIYLHHVVHTTFHIPSTSHHLTSFRLKKLPGYVADASILMENKFPTIWQPCISSAEGNMCSKRI